MTTRRRFLTSLGLLAGAGLFTGATLAPNSPRSQSGAPRRFVIFLEGNGTRPFCMRDPLTLETLEGIAGKEIKDYRDYGHDTPVPVTGAPLAEARSLGALAGGEGEVSLVERAALVLGLSGKNVGGGHSSNHGALSASRSIGGPAAATIDTVLAQIPAVRGNTPFDVVRVGVGDRNEPLNYASCAFGPGRPAPIIMRPGASFSTLFGSVAIGAASGDFAARQRLLEFALEDVERELGKLDNSSVARDKVEVYEASLEEMVARNQQINGMADALMAHKPAEPGELDPDPYASSDPLVRLKLQTDMAIGALLSGLTNVVVVSMGSGSYYWSQKYPSLEGMYPGGQMMGGHDLRHSGAPEAFEVLHEVTSRNVGEMCRVARALEAVPEQGGTMLDNTLLLHMSDNGEKHHSLAEEWVMLMIGGNNMNFQTDGRSVSYPRFNHENNRQISNMFNTLLHAAGQPTDDFGHVTPNSRVAEGPLAELWTG